ESLLVSSAEFKPPLTLVRQDLASMDDELLVMIFPRRPVEKKPDTPPAARNPQPPAETQSNTDPLTVSKPGESSERAAQADTNEEALAEKPVEKSEMPDMNIKNCLMTVALTCTLGSANCDTVQAQQKDYLSSLESDKIRDAETTNERIKLFLIFAD